MKWPWKLTKWSMHYRINLTASCFSYKKKNFRYAIRREIWSSIVLRVLNIQKKRNIHVHICIWNLGQLGLFYLCFFTVLGTIFAIQMKVSIDYVSQLDKPFFQYSKSGRTSRFTRSTFGSPGNLHLLHSLMQKLSNPYLCYSCNFVTYLKKK